MTSNSQGAQVRDEQVDMVGNGASLQQRAFLIFDNAANIGESQSLSFGFNASANPA
jgi:hypothetical protein